MSTMNSIIFRNPDEHKIIDISKVGVVSLEDANIVITQRNHLLLKGDALFYNVTTKEFDRAIGVNAKNIECCGVISEVIDEDRFILVTKGIIENTKYSYPIGSALYLSEVTPGHLVSIMPLINVKQVGYQVSEHGIEVDLSIGMTKDYTRNVEQELVPYTQEELDEIIQNIITL